MMRDRNGRAQVLYICHNALTEPITQAQVLPYLNRLARNHPIVLVSYEKERANSVHRQSRQEELDRVGIRWVPLRYHRYPPVLATAYDLARGLALCIYLVLRYRIRIVHARSYVPSVLALILKRMLGTRFVFDMRGFWADERVDAGLWTERSWLYRLAKWFEHRFLTRADVVVSLTHTAVEAMRRSPGLGTLSPRFEVIPTCTDLQLFRPLPRSLSESEPFILGYVGSVGGWCLFETVLECYRVLCSLCPGVRLVVLNCGQHDLIRQSLVAYDIPPDRVEITALPREAVAQAINRMHAGIFFYKPTWAQTARAPTKLGEFLACGVPCLANAGVGDVERILEGEGVGVILRRFDRQEQEWALARLLELKEDPGIRERCRRVASRYFSLEDGVRSYSRIYRMLAGAS